MKVFVKTTASWGSTGERLKTSGRFREVDFLEWKDSQGIGGTTVSFDVSDRLIFQFKLTHAVTNKLTPEGYIYRVLRGIDQIGNDLGCAALSIRVVNIRDEQGNILFDKVDSGYNLVV